MREIFRDKARILAAVKDEPLIEKADESIGMFSRAIGSGRSDNIMLVGVDTKKTLSEAERKEVKDMLSYIRAAIYETPADVQRAIEAIPRGIGKVTQVKMFSGKESELTGAIREKVANFRRLLTHIKEPLFLPGREKGLFDRK